MNSTVNFFRPLAGTLGLALLGFAFTTSAFAANYRATIYRITPEPATGDVIIHIKPGKNETDFSGKARVILIDMEPGTNRAMATLLTAFSLGAEIIIDVTNPPSFNDIQVINSIGLIAP